MEKCLFCGAPLDDDAIFCSNCGKKIEPQGKICPQCGAKVGTDSVFCAKCGTRLDAQEVSPMAPIEEKEEQEYDWEEENNKTWWYVIGGIVLFALAGLGSYYAFKHFDKTDNEEITELTSEANAPTQEDFVADSINEFKEEVSTFDPSGESFSINSNVDVAKACFNIINDFGRNNSYCEYFLFDITHDGIPELWIRYGADWIDTQLDVFSFNNGIKLIYHEKAGHTSHYIYLIGQDYILGHYQHMGSVSIKKISFKNGTFHSEYIYNGSDLSDDYIEPREPIIKTYQYGNKQPIYNWLNGNTYIEIIEWLKDKVDEPDQENEIDESLEESVAEPEPTTPTPPTNNPGMRPVIPEE